jgi:phosphoribosylglycinamide formyltransferase-1
VKFMVKDSTRLRLAVLISGGGTNLQALIDRSIEGSLQAEVVVVLSDQSDAYGLVRAQKAGIPTHCVDYKAYQHYSVEALPENMLIRLRELDQKQRILEDNNSRLRMERLACRMAAEQEIVRVLDPYVPDLICLAGFMRLVTPFFLQHYNQGGKWRVLNIHPALLPAFPGQHGYEDTFGYGCKWGGVTVHFVDEGEDSGPIIAQAVYPIWPDDHLEDVRGRGLELEYEVYAQCINWVAQGHVEVIQQGGPRGRFRVRVTDPSYREILRGWVQQALLDSEPMA